MSDLQKTPGASPHSAAPIAERLLPLPSAPVSLDDGTDLKSLSAEDLQARLDARERDIKYRIEAIKKEVVHVADDVNVAGRPLIDRVREKPLAALGLGLASGALLGLLWGLRRRAKRAPALDEPGDILRYHVASMVDSAARRVARGSSAADALALEARNKPVVFIPNEDETRIKPPASTQRQAIDTALKTAIGIGVKTGMDLLTKRLTGHEEVFEAVADEVGAKG